MKEIMIDGVAYVPKEEQFAGQLDGMDYCIIRTYSAGVFAGYIESREGKEAVLRNVRRIWYWAGANSLSDLANQGTVKPKDCKFSTPVNKEIVTEVIEILYCTEKAKASIAEVEEWTKK